MVTVTAPVADFTGEVVGVSFKDGTATTADPVAIGYFKRAGYKVGAAPVDDVPPASTTGAPDRSASKAKWVAFAVAHGADENEARKLTRAALIDRFAPSAPQQGIDASDRLPDVGADVLVDEQIPHPEQIVDAPPVPAAAGEDLDNDTQIIRHGKGR